MISLTRLNGIPFAINPDLIERIQETPDTILFMADGTSVIVRESQSKVIDKIADYRAKVLALAFRYSEKAAPPSKTAASRPGAPRTGGAR